MIRQKSSGRYGDMAKVNPLQEQLLKAGLVKKAKVIEVAQDMIAHGWTPEEIHFQHSHLSLAQILAALGYYYDHKAEFDATIQESLRRVSELRDQAAESPLRKRLREMGKLV